MGAWPLWPACLITPAVLRAALGSGLVWLGNRVALFGMAFDLKKQLQLIFTLCV